MKLAVQTALFACSACLSLTIQAAEISQTVGKSQIDRQAGVDTIEKTGYVSKSIERGNNVAANTTYLKDGKITNFKVVSGQKRGLSRATTTDLATGKTTQTTIKTKEGRHGSLNKVVRTRSGDEMIVERSRIKSDGTSKTRTRTIQLPKI